LPQTATWQRPASRTNVSWAARPVLTPAPSRVLGRMVPVPPHAVRGRSGTPAICVRQDCTWVLMGSSTLSRKPRTRGWEST